MSVEFRLDRFSREEWQHFCQGFDLQNLFQTWDFAVSHSPKSWLRDLAHCGLFEDGRPLCLAQIRIKRIPVLGQGVAFLYNGPLWRAEDYPDSMEHLRTFIQQVKEECCIRRNLELRIIPQVTYPYNVDEEVGLLLSELGFLRRKEIANLYQTIFIDLDLDEETLRKNLRGSWRRELKKGENAGLVIDMGQTVDYFDRFIALYVAMREVKDFYTGIRTSIIRRMHVELPEDHHFVTSIARDGETDVGAMVCATNGKRLLYYLGASHPDRRGSAPGYLLQWYNIQKGKQLGLKWYDLMGLGGPGVARFKLGMGGSLVTAPYEFQALPGRKPSRAFHLAETAFKKVRHLVSRR